MRNEREDIIENFFMKLDRLTFKAVKIMCIFAPLYILFRLIF
jgi:hypothetical protein